LSKLSKLPKYPPHLYYLLNYTPFNESYCHHSRDRAIKSFALSLAAIGNYATSSLDFVADLCVDAACGATYYPVVAFTSFSERLL